MNLANNHALDYGEVGQQRHRARPSGRRGSADDRTAGRDRVREGARCACRRSGVRAVPLGAEPAEPDCLAEALVRKADRWVDLVVVTMHAGAEGSDHQHVRPGNEWFLGENRGNSVAFAHSVVRAGADLVVGSGPHVLRGMEWYRGRLIAYSLGNFVGYQTLNTSGVHRRERRSCTWTLRARRRLGRQDGWTRSRSPATAFRGLTPTAQRAAWSRTLSREDFGTRGIQVSTSGELRRP